MSELNFSFPIVRDIEATKQRHQVKIGKLKQAMPLKSVRLFLNDFSNDDLFESIMYLNHMYFSYYSAQHWRGQRGVKEIKGIVNTHVRSLIADYLVGNAMPKSWDTAYYLLHQSLIDNRMESVSKLIYADLS